MSFFIWHTREKDLDLISIRDEDNGTVISLIPGFGATLHTFAVSSSTGQPFNVIDNYTDLDDLKTNMPLSFKGPKLSPFPCRIRAGKYRFDGSEYQFSHLFGDGTAIHGLVFDKPFQVLQETADDQTGSVVMVYAYKKDDPGYPFDYDCQVRFTLHPQNILEIVTTVTNLGQHVIPIADGWHPYFRLDGKIDDWRLQFHAAALVEFDTQLVPTGRLIQYDTFENAHPIGDTFLDNCFSLKPDLVSAACEIHNESNGLTISFFPDASYPYLQIYTPPARTSIAIENLSGAPDCFNNKMGLTLLAPGHSQIFTVRYKVGIR